MKIVLISPKGPLYRHKGGLFKKSLRYQPLTLTTLAALIPEDMDVELQLIDEGIETIQDDLEADLIGMTVITGTSTRARELAATFRKRNIKVVLGGPHVTLLPEEAQQYADAICVGYAEKTWPRLLRDFSEGNLQSVYHQQPGMELGRTPFPKRELMDERNFLTQAVFEASRSCVHDCEFCVAPAAWGRKQYQRPIDWVIEDIQRVGQKKIIFIDLNLISDKKYAKALFRQLIPLNIHWFGLSTVLIAHDEELKELMARSGCKGLLLGFETVCEQSLKDAKKRFNALVGYKSLISDLHHLGISIQGCFVFGLDHDTADVFDATVAFSIDAGVDLPRFAILTPFPGTPIYKRMEAQNRILTRDWQLYDGQHVVFQPKNISVRELSQGHEKAWKKVYRWSSVARRLWRAGNFTFLAVSANLGYRFYAHHLHRYYNCDMQINPVATNPPAFMSSQSQPVTESTNTKNKTVCG
ncbi:MAG: B12-binding domain-containing radical SAM protein [Gammaproteobacteria bacterium]|nr:B12-binding domain-containing radical SAM protein [Gammaproteobacteria bacterium]